MFSEKECKAHVEQLLFAAIRAGNAAEVLRLISCNNAYNTGFTLLHYAVFNNKPNVVEALLNRGIGMEGIDEVAFFDETPLCYAARVGLKAIVTILLSAGADANQKNTYNLTPLHSAALRFSQEETDELIAAKVEIARMLLEAGADINKISEIERSKFEQLCLRPIDKSKFNKLCLTPLTIAFLFDRVDMVKLFLQNEKINFVAPAIEEFIKKEEEYSKRYHLEVRKSVEIVKARKAMLLREFNEFALKSNRSNPRMFGKQSGNGE